MEILCNKIRWQLCSFCWYRRSRFRLKKFKT